MRLSPKFKMLYTIKYSKAVPRRIDSPRYYRRHRDKIKQNSTGAKQSKLDIKFNIGDMIICGIALYYIFK